MYKFSFPIKEKWNSMLPVINKTQSQTLHKCTLVPLENVCLQIASWKHIYRGLIPVIHTHFRLTIPMKCSKQRLCEEILQSLWRLELSQKVSLIRGGSRWNVPMRGALNNFSIRWKFEQIQNCAVLERLQSFVKVWMFECQVQGFNSTRESQERLNPNAWKDWLFLTKFSFWTESSPESVEIIWVFAEKRHTITSKKPLDNKRQNWREICDCWLSGPLSIAPILFLCKWIIWTINANILQSEGKSYKIFWVLRYTPLPTV